VPLLSHPTSCTPTKSNLHFDSFFATVICERALHRHLTFRIPNLMSIFLSFRRLSKESVQVQGSTYHLVQSMYFRFRRFKPHAQHPSWGTNPYWLSANYSPCLEAVSFIRNLRTRHAVLTRDKPNMASGRIELMLLNRAQKLEHVRNTGTVV
jgi:hypothetical protein